MSSFELVAETRDAFGKEKAKKIRQSGRFPAIVYGADAGSIPLSLDSRDTELVLGRIHGEKVLVDLKYADRAEKVFVRNVQRDPVTDRLLHVDFFRVDLNREMDTSIPVFSVGIAAGVKEGGILEPGIRELAIRCLPTKVPPHLDINVESIALGHSLHVRDLAPIDGVIFLTPGDAVLFAVVGRQAEETPAVAASTAEVPVAAVPAAAPAAKA